MARDGPSRRPDDCGHPTAPEPVARARGRGPGPGRLRRGAAPGQAMAALRESGQLSNTVVILLGDHGPCFVHGKMTVYDLGLRVPLVISGPGLATHAVSDGLVSELDIFPTRQFTCRKHSEPTSVVNGFSVKNVPDLFVWRFGVK